MYALISPLGVVTDLYDARPDLHPEVATRIEEVADGVSVGMTRQTGGGFAFDDGLAHKAAGVRAERDARLTACDWTQLPDSPLTVAVKAAWTTYRQALRDVPEQAGFPSAVEWPVEPA
jgi:hypothetical protein